MSITVITGDCRKALKKIPDRLVHCCMTSPPYYNLRDYGADGQIGLEETPEEYVNELVNVFREVRRVLRDDGTLWLNLGDSYASGKPKEYNSNGYDDPGWSNRPSKKAPSGFKPKDLIGIPWRVAFALQADGWYLRSDIIWNKPNPMPESVTDRPTKAHEYVFLLSKSKKYFYDNEAVKEKSVTNDDRRPYTSNGAKQLDSREIWHSGEKRENGDFTKRNRRSVWNISTKSYSGAHFATFPLDLVEPCLKAGTSERGCCPECGAPWVRDVENGVCWRPSCTCNAGDPIQCTALDPFGGSGTVGEWCRHNGRDAILIELNPEYISLINARTMNNIPELSTWGAV